MFAEHMRVVRELSHFQYLRQQIVAEFPDVDEESLADTLEGLTDLNEALAEVARSQLEDTNLAEAVKIRMSDMQARLKRLEARAAKKRELIAKVMDRAGVKKIAQADLTLSLRLSPAPVLITAEQEIPGEYWKPQAPKLDRARLGADLKVGKPIPGATLGNGGITISIRTK